MSVAIRRRPRTRRVLKWITVMVAVLPMFICITLACIGYVARQPQVVRWSHPQSAFVLARKLLVLIVGDYPEHVLALHDLRRLNTSIPAKSRDEISDDDVAGAALLMVRRPHRRDFWLLRVHTFPADYCRYYATTIPRATAAASIPFAVLLLRQWLRRRRKQYRRLHSRCLSCGYDLTGNVSGICPECGTPVAGE